MKISGAELAAQRTAQRKHRELFNYGDLIAYRATKFPNPKAQDEAPLSRAYHAACLMEPARCQTTAPQQSWFFVTFGGTSDRKLPLSAELTVLEHSDDSADPELNDPSYIDPQFTTSTAETWQLSVQHADQSLAMLNDFTLPIALVGHSMIPYRAKNKLIIYGGAQLGNRSMFSHIYVVSMKTFEVKQFRVKKGAQPAGRLRHSACLWNDRMYIYGGQSHSSAAKCLEDFWCLDLVKSEWKQIASVQVVAGETVGGAASSLRSIETQLDYDRSHGPGKRFGQHMVVYKGVIYLAFGSDGSCVLDDVWGFKDNYWFRLQLLNHLGDPYANLQGRVDCAAALNEESGMWVFHGGINAEGHMLNTLLEINLETHECRRTRVEVFDEDKGGVAQVCKSLSSHYANPKSSISSSNGSGGRLLPALRGHVMIHVPKTNMFILTRGVSRYNEFTQTEYILTFTGLSPLKLRKPPIAAPPDMPNPKYEVTAIFDTTHYWQQKNMPDQPPTLLQDDLRAVDTAETATQLSQVVPSSFISEERDPISQEQTSDLASSDREFSPMLIPQRLSAPRRHSSGDQEPLKQNSCTDMRPASASSSGEPGRAMVTRESETTSSSPEARERTPHIKQSIGRAPRLPGDHVKTELNILPDHRSQRCTCSSLTYWKARCLDAERENARLRTELERLASTLNTQQNIITDVAHLLSQFSFVDIDQ